MRRTCNETTLKALTMMDEKIQVCPYCGREVTPGVENCRYCGRPVVIRARDAAPTSAIPTMPTARPVSTSATRPDTQSASTHASRPASTPANQSASTSTSRPTNMPSSRPTSTPAARPIPRMKKAGDSDPTNKRKKMLRVSILLLLIAIILFGTYELLG